MNWKKKGLIFNPKGKFDWAQHSALQPTPMLINDTIRVYCGFRDSKGISRIGFVDLLAKDPSRVIRYSKEPILDCGKPGMFDDNGVVPLATLEYNGQIYLFYAGYQIEKHVRFTVFTGVAISTDNGQTFTRKQETPIFDRLHKESLFRAIHSIHYDNNRFRLWYGSGNKFINLEGKTVPCYDIKYLEAQTLDDLNKPGKTIIKLDKKRNEYRVARPYVIKNNNSYEMFFGKSLPDCQYCLCYATSDDGIKWKRQDDKIGLKVSKSGWDSEMIAYPSIIKTEKKMYLFYNGNNYGYDGFGYAELIT